MLTIYKYEIISATFSRNGKRYHTSPESRVAAMAGRDQVMALGWQYAGSIQKVYFK